MGFRKEKRWMYALFAIGAVCAIAGLILYLKINVAAGIIAMISGISLFMFGAAMQNMFYRLDMAEMYERRSGKLSKK